MLMIIASYVGLVLFCMACVFMLFSLFIAAFTGNAQPPWPTKEMLTLGGEWQMWDEGSWDEDHDRRQQLIERDLCPGCGEEVPEKDRASHTCVEDSHHPNA